MRRTTTDPDASSHHVCLRGLSLAMAAAMIAGNTMTWHTSQRKYRTVVIPMPSDEPSPARTTLKPSARWPSVFWKAHQHVGW